MTWTDIRQHYPHQWLLVEGTAGAFEDRKTALGRVGHRRRFFGR